MIIFQPCNPKHSDYREVSSICDSEELDDSSTQFRWSLWTKLLFYQKNRFK